MNPLASLPTARPSITAVIVLYQRAPSQSQALSALIQILSTHPELAQHFSLVVYDNSPQPHSHEISADFATHYVHDPANGGVAAAYNYALARAEQLKHEWLLLFDHDTSPTYEFFVELVGCTNTLGAQFDIAAIVPKLLVRGEISSPQEPFLNIVRRPFSRARLMPDRQATGLRKGPLSACNSGATLRVSALRAIGGFPKEFWLDFLDCAVFHALSIHGCQMYVMQSMLEHDSSQSDLSSAAFWRQRNMLRAQTLFVKKTGSFTDQLLHRIWLLRSSRRFWLSCKDRRIWREAVLQAIRLKTTAEPADQTNRVAPS